MSLLISPDTPYGKELWKWDHREDESHPSDSAIRGMRPAVFRAYPAMLYRPLQKNPWQFEERVVGDEVAERLAVGQGFVAGGKASAAAAFDARQQDMALAAAHRNYEDRGISERARQEVDAVEQASSKHVGEIPRTPIKKRGRPFKASPPAA